MSIQDTSDDGQESQLDQHIAGLTMSERDTLLVLAGMERASGREVVEAYEESPLPAVNFNSVYRSLRTLVACGLAVETSHRDSRTNCYEITHTGFYVLRKHKLLFP